MPKGMKGYEDQKPGGYTKYPAEGAKVTKNGGNKGIHDGVTSSGQKYPKPNGKGSGKTGE